tara:strand:- start:730 stop:1380 length:651 start_codon:yes stop_codon:yes gene_type:complete
MGVYYFPSEFVYWTDNPKHLEMKDELITKISLTEERYKNNNPGLDNAFTSFDETESLGKISFLSEPHILQELVYNPFEKMLDEYNSRKNIDKIYLKNCIVDNGWYTKYNTGGNFKMHNHDDSSIKHENDIFRSAFSFIYILNDKNEINNTEFFLPSMCRTSALGEYDYTLDTGDVTEIKEGSVLIFPSSLYHHVNPCKVPGRITISYNMKCCFPST